MTLQQEFEFRISLLNNVGVHELTPRLVSLLKWMYDQPGIKKVLDDLKARSPLTPIINSADPNRYKKAARSAVSPDAIAIIGLYMMEACTWTTGGNLPTPLCQIAALYGVQTSPMAQKPENFADAAMRRYIEPFFAFLRTQMPEEAHPTKEAPMPQSIKYALSVFISHSSKDEKLAAALVELLRNALNIPADEIRCTSANGYLLPIGARIEDQLREEVQQARAFIGLITESSIASAYVMFELGARWGAKLHLAPLLGGGADSDSLLGPLGSLNALNCEDVAQVHQLIDDLARALDVQKPTKPAAYQRYVEELITASTSNRSINKVSLRDEEVMSENKYKVGVTLTNGVTRYYDADTYEILPNQREPKMVEFRKTNKAQHTYRTVATARWSEVAEVHEPSA